MVIEQQHILRIEPIRRTLRQDHSLTPLSAAAADCVTLKRIARRKFASSCASLKGFSSMVAASTGSSEVELGRPGDQRLAHGTERSSRRTVRPSEMEVNEGYVRSMLGEQTLGFTVRDGNGQVAYVYCEDEPARQAAAKLLTRHEARRIAANIAKLSEMLPKPK